MAESASDVFTYLAKYRVVVCGTCCFAVWPGQARTHLTKHHRGILPKARFAIATELSMWPDIFQQLEDPDRPNSIPHPLPELPLFVDGL